MIILKEIQKLINWFKNSSRDLPWRENPTPYSVWVSEVMLQQTRASVVIPYFLRWMAKYPTIEALALAPLEAIIKDWEGLGYYSRARNLHQGAKQLMQDWQGQLPQDPAQLAKIKGLGPYTIGAICSFAFKQKKAAVDGNVMRVLARYFAIKEDISKPAVVNKIRILADDSLPEHEPWIAAEAFIELGATICARTPQCDVCPLKATCQGYREGNPEKLPIKSKKIKIENLHREVAVIYCQDRVLARKCAQNEIMADLYEFPYYEKDEISLENKVHNLLGLRILRSKKLPLQKQTFTRYKACLEPYFFAVDTQEDAPAGFLWVSVADLERLPFSSGHRKVCRAAFAS